jgi:hypothetical protein
MIGRLPERLNTIRWYQPRIVAGQRSRLRRPTLVLGLDHLLEPLGETAIAVASHLLPK